MASKTRSATTRPGFDSFLTAAENRRGRTGSAFEGRRGAGGGGGGRGMRRAPQARPARPRSSSRLLVPIETFWAFPGPPAGKKLRDARGASRTASNLRGCCGHHPRTGEGGTWRTYRVDGNRLVRRGGTWRPARAEVPAPAYAAEDPRSGRALTSKALLSFGSGTLADQERVPPRDSPSAPPGGPVLLRAGVRRRRSRTRPWRRCVQLRPSGRRDLRRVSPPARRLGFPYMAEFLGRHMSLDPRSIEPTAFGTSLAAAVRRARAGVGRVPAHRPGAERVAGSADADKVRRVSTTSRELHGICTWRSSRVSGSGTTRPTSTT